MNELTPQRAAEIIDQVAEENGEGFLETLTYMTDNITQFNNIQRQAFYTIMASGRKMFAPV